MPTLDVADVLLDPLFIDQVAVTRNAVTVNSVGRNVTTPSTFNIYAVVTIGSLTPIVRTAEEEHATNFITLHTQTKLFDVVAGYQPDIVAWEGNDFVVTKVNKWSRYGVGFYATECEMISLESTAS